MIIIFSTNEKLSIPQNRQRKEERCLTFGVEYQKGRSRDDDGRPDESLLFPSETLRGCRGGRRGVSVDFADDATQ